MLSLCRLCANCMDGIETSIDISELEPKLRVCCGWNQSENEWRMPRKACKMCADELQRCWSFSEKVRTAEQKLNKLTSEMVLNECELTSEIEEVSMGLVKEEMYVDSIGLENFEHDFDSGGFDDPVYGSDSESLYLNKTKIKKCKKPTKKKKKATKKTKLSVNSVQAVQSNENTIGVKGERTKKHKESTSKTAEKMSSDVDPFLAALSDDDRLNDGKINENGVKKLEKLFPAMKTMTWIECQYKCKKCNQTFKSSANYFAHNRSYHLEETKSMDYFCFYCNSKHRREYTLNRHIAETHFSHLKLGCFYCTDYFWSESELIKHRNMHKDIEYKCEQCGKVTWNRENLYMHVAQSHFDRKYGDPEAIFICDICNRVCATKTSIQNHLLQHTQKFDYICDQCGWKFRTKGNLKSHLETTHGNVRPFSCKQCDKRFKTKSQMEKHSQIHEDYKPIECTVCKKRFRNNSNLTVHMRSHNKICPYTCKYCDKKFSYTSSWRTHERTHTDEKPYACNHCHYKSTNWPNLNKHSLQVHSIDLRIKKDVKI